MPPCGLSTVDGDYDLSALVGTTFNASSDETPFVYDYFVGVCAAVPQCAQAESPDPAGSGSCQVIQDPDPTSPPESFTFDNGAAAMRCVARHPPLLRPSPAPPSACALNVPVCRLGPGTSR